MSNVFSDPGATDVHITAINNTGADLASNLDTCQIGIETDTGLLAHKDESDVYHVSAPKSTLTAGKMTKCKTAATGELEDATNTDAEVASAVTLKHAQQHAVTSTSDHTSSATSGQMLKADANGLPVNATNTDAQVAAAVSASHARQHAITSSSDHTSSATSGTIQKADSNGLPVDSLFTETAVGDLKLFAAGGVVAIGYNATTTERGFLTKYVNRTGGNSVKGTLVSLSTTADSEIIKQANEYDTIGIVAEAGISEGSECWVWKNGSRCQVLFKDSVASTHGNILIAADTDGRAIDIANPGVGLPGTDTHFKECGHVCESKTAGTDVLVLCDIHFN